MIIDSHCDTALKLLNGSDINSKNNQFTLDNALTYDKYIQFFAMYIEPEYVKSGEYNLCINLINSVKKEVDKNNEYTKIITTKYELNKYLDLKTKALGIILSVEDASCLEGNIENLQRLYDNGIRVIGLTWNLKNEVASGAGCLGNEDDGLSKFGEEVVRKMNELNIIIDVSHLSEKSFYDVMRVTDKPVIASHSCSKTICNHRRNLSDDQIRLISSRGGIIGINFYSEFLSDNTGKADIECLVKHIKHIYSVGGKNCIGLGSDYDGMKKDKIVTGLEDNSKLISLFDYLKKENFSDEDIDRIMWKNELEFLIRELK
jgi:membrane dipeptidase